jgi:hypothetical protein
MLPEHFCIALPIAACALALALSGGAAVPLTQIAVTQMAAQPACLPMSACQPGPASGSFGDISFGFGDSFRVLTSRVSDNQPAPPQARAN